MARSSRLGRSRIIWGWLAGVAGPALLAVLLNQVVPDLGLANDMLLFLTFTVAAALLGGLLPALASAAFGSLLLNYYFTPPLHEFTISDPKNIVAIAIFVGVAVSVASVVDLAARRTHKAARLRAEPGSRLAASSLVVRPSPRRTRTPPSSTSSVAYRVAPIRTADTYLSSPERRAAAVRARRAAVPPATGGREG